MEQTIFWDEAQVMAGGGYSTTLKVRTDLNDDIQVEAGFIGCFTLHDPATARTMAAMLDAAAGFLEGQA